MADSAETTVTKMPKEIAKAVLGVMGSLGTLEKGNENKFDRYEFASIDDFLSFVRGPCIANGLFFIPQEAEEPKLIEMKKKDGSPLMMWWHRFAFEIAHSSGEMYGPIYKTVKVQAGGAQASGSAQSYALKQLQRALFLIPTGDKDDPDTKGTAELATAASSSSKTHQEAQRLYDKLKKADGKDAFLKIWNDNVMLVEDIKDTLPNAYAHLEKLRKEKVS